MRTNYLIPNKFKPVGWILFIAGIVSGLFLFGTDYETEILNVKVLAVYGGDSIFSNDQGFFKIIENSILDELIALAIIFGGLVIGFSKEKVEDEFIYKLRKDSLVWALLFNYLVLSLAIIFIYDFTFFDVLVFNMFTPLIFFVIRFNFLKLKSQSNEE
ncbi:MAG: hypothetical protein HKN00_12375 [Flavobacteriaceae bacterium]|nr:hypothetical protein [Bacteroidia bacterium]MBT8268259.1 hypothetical protein [Bacteroidia bacterium]NNF75977.1 hypothetical protein [Flavobacteriaceae bacterium]NNK70848.1 hypothetical protein [Flavobacteriaceae bacterium]NNL81099.1 hypothetical protein [Flavobacteriaceae bacterium]